MYAAPALITLVLLLLETVFLIVALPETRGRRAVPTPEEKAAANGQANGHTNGHTNGHANGHANGNGVHKDAANGHAPEKATAAQRLHLLGELRQLHFLFLGVFSGVEFTLTFLTFDRTPPSLSSAAGC